MRIFPISLSCLVLTAIVLVLQFIPIIGIFLMFMFAAFWSVILVNAAMIGTAVEALTGRVSRWWLLLPALFYGGYFSFAAADHFALAQLGTAYDAANAKIAIPFNPQRQALVFEDSGNNGSWFVQNYNLPVAYARNPNHPESFRSNRMMAREICLKVRGTPTFGAAGIYTFGFFDGDGIYGRKMESRFCEISMPERPTRPKVIVAAHEERFLNGTLPVTRVTTIVTTSDGRHYSLLGGVAAPLSWIPMPVMGCGLNSGAPSWDCSAAFWRNGFTPIVAGKTRYSRDALVLARALGLRRIEIADRKGGDPTFVLAKMAEVEEATLARQLAAVDEMIADPTAKVKDWQTSVLANRPEILAARADAIMLGLERAAAIGGADRPKARESGRILARLVAQLPDARFQGFGSRILSLYRKNFNPEPHDGEQDSHWLWESESLLRRLGDLGPNALPILIDFRASIPNVNGAGVEGMCRVGAAGKTVAGPVLLTMWRNTDKFDRDQQRSLFIAMRRVGVPVPPIAETHDGAAFVQKRNPMAEFMQDWGDVSPTSPPRVCSPIEWRTRREKQFLGKRRANV